MTETDLLVIVPHEDDELAIAGAMIYGAVQRENEYKSCVCHERRLLQT